MMAAAQQLGLQALEDVATCSICLDYFTDPVSLDCRHNFCRSCITCCRDGGGADPPCPQCRSPGRNLRPNTELAIIVGLIKLNILPTAGDDDGGVCQKHLQRLQLFCAEDHTLLCVICRESQEHKPHSVSPIQEAAQGYRGTLHSHMAQLSTELQDLEQQRTKGRRTVSELQEDLQNQTEQVCRTFEKLMEYLEREKQLLLSRLEKEHEENLKKITGPLAHLEEELSARRDLVAAMERKCELPDPELLMDVEDILRRCDRLTGQNPKDQNIQCLRHRDLFQEKVMDLKKGFPAELEWHYVKNYECEMTLDPDTAHRSLIVSEDGTSVRDGGTSEELPDTTRERFSTYCIVLGRQRLTSGRHYWEVAVGDAAEWYLGVCDESARRKGEITLEAKDGYWIFCHIDGKYLAHTPPYIPLTPRVHPRVVALFLDCEAGRLSVYNPQDRSLLFTFSGVSSPRTLRPFFSPEFSESENPVAALQILPVKAQE